MLSVSSSHAHTDLSTTSVHLMGDSKPTSFPFELALIYLNKEYHASISPHSTEQLTSSTGLQPLFNHFQSRVSFWIQQEHSPLEIDAFYEPFISPWIMASRRKAEY
ncbi:hypothetical protein HMI54_014021 [Coelomomyces lativittatus]|nr:hypothetical protein HMI54_014021 [Coelomomyces lativittatus]KAJ1499631.1 hypothetical protein HMI55_004296 [Coelomomyces lativittatus]